MYNTNFERICFSYPRVRQPSLFRKNKFNGVSTTNASPFLKILKKNVSQVSTTSGKGRHWFVK